MKTRKLAIGMLGLLAPALTAAAGQADSSASASSNGWRPGTATATAGYDGNGVGIARTNTKSGKVNFGHGFAVGFDDEGLSVSSSFAVAPAFGPAVASTFNMGVGLDGSVSHSVGRSVASGDRNRSVDAGGTARPPRYGRSGATMATAGGKTGPRGKVIAKTNSKTHRPRFAKRGARPVIRLRRR